jgi:CRISPR-associated exonuclease Cas4
MSAGTQAHPHKGGPLEPPLTATDLKQWAYCRRIPYYRYVMPVAFAPTYPMQRGRNVEEAVAALERRRGLRRYGLERGERRFGVWLRSQRLGLSGKLDLLVITAKACFPVDFKDTRGGVRANHRMQLAAYSLLAEEAYGRPARAGFIYAIPTRQLIEVPIGRRERQAVVEAMAEVREMVADGLIPEPTPVRARCVACEFRNFCGDIW